MSVEVSSLYSVAVPSGSWVPLKVSVTDHAGTDLQGALVVTSPVPQLSGGVPYCYSTGGTTACVGTFPGLRRPGYPVGGYGFGFGSAYSMSTPTTPVSYRFPLDIAPGTTKTLELDVLAPGPQNHISAEVLSLSGEPLAHAGAQVQVASMTTPPAVLVVTGDPSALSPLSWPVPGGPDPQLEVLPPMALPGSSAALSGFSAVVVDEADTSPLSPAQRRALEAYVEEGGTLVVVGGLSYGPDIAGLPADLLPARVLGVHPLRLGKLASLLGAPAPAQPVPTDRLELKPGAATVLSEGTTPLAAEAPFGSGEVVFSAFDPAAAPLAGWSGAQALQARLTAPAYQAAYQGTSQVVFAGKGFISTVANSSTPFTNSTPSAVGPQVDGSALAPYLYQMPGASLPKPGLFGLLLLGYVLVAGPASFIALQKFRRRQLAWVALPSIATAVALVAYATGAGISRGPLSDEVNVARIVPGSHLAEVTSLGAVYFPSGGSSELSLPGDGPVSDLGAGAGATLSVGPQGAAGARPGETELTLEGPSDSLGGWAATQDTSLKGSFSANVVQSGEEVSGWATNRLGVGLADVVILNASGQEHRVGPLPDGASASFSFPAPSADSGEGQSPVVVPLFLVGGSGLSRGATRQQAAEQGLSELATDYSSSIGGWPVLIGIAHKTFLPPSRARMPLSVTDAVVVPLAPAEGPRGKLVGLQPQLVGSEGLSGAVAIGPAGGTLTLTKGGSLDYQFTLPGGRWRFLELDLGSPSGSPPGLGFSPNFGAVAGLGLASGAPSAKASDFTLSAFDYEDGKWHALRAFVGGAALGGDFEAVIDDPAPYLGPWGTLELRLEARVSGLQVFGAVPTLSAFPAR